MDFAGKLERLIRERQALRDLSDPLRLKVEDLKGQIYILEGPRAKELDEQIAALVEFIDLGLDRVIEAP